MTQHDSTPGVLRWLIFGVLGVVATLPVTASEEQQQEPHFRNVRWYDTLTHVKEAETARFLEHRKQETNVAVTSPKPWPVEHLYYEDYLLDKHVLILYRFDLECRQLFEAGYIFDEVLDDVSLFKIIDAIQVKYDVELQTATFEKPKFFTATGDLNDETKIVINQYGRLHFHNNNTVVYFETTNYSWLGGWVEGTEPKCPEKTETLRKLQEKL